MDKVVKEEIWYRLKSIIRTSLFLMITTWFWYGPRVDMQKQSEVFKDSYAYAQGVSVINENSVNINDSKNSGEYKFTLKNNSQEERTVLVTLVADYTKINNDSCTMLKYNNISYNIKEQTEEDYSRVRTLSLSGEVMVVTLGSEEEKTYSLNYFTEEENLDKEHFHGHVVLSNGQNI